MTVRTDAELKAVFVKLCEEFGMSANTAMNVFMRAVAETKSIPFTIGKSKGKEAEHLLKLFEENRLANADREELSLEEINAEISSVRKERLEGKK